MVTFSEQIYDLKKTSIRILGKVVQVIYQV